MRKKLVSILLLVLLLTAPVTQMAFAQETDTDGETPDDGVTDPPAVPTGNSTGTVTVLPDGNTTEPVVVVANVTEIDPLIYEMVRNDAEARYAELYALVFGQPIPISEPETPPAEVPDVNSTDPVVDGNTTIPGDLLNGTVALGTGLELIGTEVFVEVPEGYLGPMIPDDTDPAIMNQFVHAWSAMESAESKTNPRAAANQYLRAMKQLSNAYRKFQKTNPVAAVGEVDETGVPLGDIPVEPTAEELSDAQLQLVGSFQERFQERVAVMLDNYNEVQGSLSPEDAVKALNALTKAEEKLLRIQTRIDSGEIDGALDDLDDTTVVLDDDFSSFDDDASSQMFKTMNKLEAKIGKMVEKADRKAAKGEDASDLEAELAKVRGNSDKTKTDFKEDKEKGNSDKDTGKPDKDTGKPDKDTGKPDKDKGNQGQGNN
jgi:hypothetical protein